MFCSVTARYPASNSKHVLFGAKHAVYPQPWLISCSSVTAKSKTKPIQELSNRFIKWVYSLSGFKALFGKYRRITKLNISAILLENAVTWHHVIYHLPLFEYRIAHFSTGMFKKMFRSVTARNQVSNSQHVLSARNTWCTHTHCMRLISCSSVMKKRV